MAKKNYFDDDEKSEQKKSHSAGSKPVFSSLLGRINEQKAEQQKAETKSATPKSKPQAPSISDDILNMINSDPAALTANTQREEAPEPKKAERPPVEKPKTDAEKISSEEKEITVAATESESDDDEVSGAIKAFSRKSGERISSVAHTIRESTIAVAAHIEESERTASKWKKFLVVLSMLLVMVIVFEGVIYLFIRQMNVENDRMKDFNTAAGKVCADYVGKYGAAGYENLYNTYGVNGYRLTGLCFVREIDFDTDGKSELMVAYNKNGIYYNEVWGFDDNGEFVSLFSEKAAQPSSKAKDSYSTLYRKNNKYYIGIHSEKNLNKIALYQLKGGSFVKRFDCVYNAKEKSYEVDGKDDTTAFERIKYSVFISEKAAVEAEKVEKTIDRFSGSAENESKADSSTGYKKAYYDVVKEYNKRYGYAKYIENYGKAYISGLAVVELVDFNGDGTDEMLLVYRKPVKVRDETDGGYNSYEVDTYCCEIYTYSGAKAVLAYSSEGISQLPDGSDDAYIVIRNKGKKAFYCQNTFSSREYGQVVRASSSMLRFNGKSFVSSYSSSYISDYGYREYYLEDEEVSSSEFEEKGYDVPLFNGEESGYDASVFDVIFVQRAEKYKADVEGRVDKTVEAISLLNASYSPE